MMKAKKFVGRTIRLLLFILIFILIVSMFLLLLTYYSAKLDKNAILTHKAEVEVFSSQDEPIINQHLNRYVEYEDISPHVINAFVALEDKRFWHHNGVDYKRLAGAFLHDLKSLSLKEGGSTITQQLAKNTMLSGEKTLKRKIKELRLAKLIEKEYSKEQILEFYLNAIYFGSGIYGIDSAAKNYFMKSAKNLSPAESALLAGIVKSPSRYSPKINLEKALERRNLVLKLMHEQNYLNEKEYDFAKNSNYTPPKDVFSDQICTPYYNNVLSEASSILNLSEKDLVLSDYKIYTYYDKKIQTNLKTTLNSDDYIRQNSSGNKPSASALIADNETGGINAFYANEDLDVFSFRRQPGSLIKPILVYAPALEYNYITPETSVFDERISINGYSPSNFSNRYYGWITAKTALAKSVNSVPVKLLNEIGIKKSKEFATKCGLSFSEKDNLASALGGLTDGLTQLEIAEAYMTIANTGYHQKCTFIRKIVDSNGKIVYQNDEEKNKAMSRDTAYLLTDMLKNTVKEGTASKLNGFAYEIASKTGTVQSTKCNDNLDAWNACYTTEKTIVVWFGDLLNTPETALETTGSALPTLTARKILTDLPAPNQRDFLVPDTVFSIEIDEFAQEKDHELYLCTFFTPEKYRKKAYFSLQNCPLRQSPYFDIRNILFTVENVDEAILIHISADEPYSYILEKNNLFTSTKEEKTFSSSGIYTLPNEEGFFSYRLKIYYQEKILGVISPTPIFENSGLFPRD